MTNEQQNELLSRLELIAREYLSGTTAAAVYSAISDVIETESGDNVYCRNCCNVNLEPAQTSNGKTLLVCLDCGHVYSGPTNGEKHRAEIAFQRLDRAVPTSDDVSTFVVTLLKDYFENTVCA